MEKFTLSKQLIALSAITSENKSRQILQTVHIGETRAIATNGHMMAILPIATDTNTDGDTEFNHVQGVPAGTNLNLRGLKAHKSTSGRERAGFYDFIPTGNGGENYEQFLSSCGMVETIEGTFPDPAQVTPTVSLETHFAISLNAEYLLTLMKALREQGHKDDAAITLLLPRNEALDAVGILTNTGKGAGILMPMRQYSNGEAKTWAAEQCVRFNLITGKAMPVETPLEAEAEPEAA